jgi:flavin reductase (DIM6/NTAB) family NADH-FMN oxidoreductase RutF
MSVDRSTMRDTLRFWASGVSIVATLAPHGQPAYPYAGMTVSSLMSLSLEPAQILVSLAKQSTTADSVLASKIFSVSVLTAEQAPLADRFAGRSDLSAHQNRFDGVPVITAATGAPILQAALAWLDCRVVSVHDGSTHWIVVGEVVATGHREDDVSPLLYFNRAYASITPEREQP